MKNPHLEECTSAASQGLDRSARAGLEERFACEAFPLRGELIRIAHRYTPSIHDAEDLVQETFVKAWLGFESCTPSSNLRAWMVRIMINTWIDNHRKTQRRPREVLAGSATDAQISIDRQQRTHVQSAEETALTHLPNDRLRQSIRALPIALQAALFYADVCQFSVRQIAEIESIPMGTVMSRLHRARRGLRSAMSEEGTPDPVQQPRPGMRGDRSPAIDSGNHSSNCDLPAAMACS
ncbi:MAG: sigma-70 family RNA polymerase sigma factor [Mycobacterium sp.]